jgi:hypothetical protein
MIITPLITYYFPCRVPHAGISIEKFNFAKKNFRPGHFWCRPLSISSKTADFFGIPVLKNMGCVMLGEFHVRKHVSQVQKSVFPACESGRVNEKHVL